MSKNEFDNAWLIGYMAKRRAEKDPLCPFSDAGSRDVPDPGLESELQQKVLDYCKENGWPCFHDRSKKVNEPGWPDNIIFLPKGKVLLIELKSSAGKLRKEQYELRRVLGWNDHIVYIAKSFKRVVEIIQRELKGD